MTENGDRKKSQGFEESLDQPAESLAREFWAFLKENKKWWLAPILISVLGLGLLVLLGGSAAAPFIYTLF